MESRRRSKRNDIYVKIRMVEKSIERNQNTRKRLVGKYNQTYNDNQQSILNEKLKGFHDELEKLHNDLNDLDKGLMDEIIDNDINKNQNEMMRFRAISNEKKKKMKENKEKKKDIYTRFWNKKLKDIRSNKYDKRVQYGAFRHYQKTSDYIPLYIIKKLDNMPCNHGIIWNDVYFYGVNKEQPGPVVMIEKKKNSQLLTIHEYDENEYRVYEKLYNNRRKLVKIQQKTSNLVDSYYTSKGLKKPKKVVDDGFKVVKNRVNLKGFNKHVPSSITRTKVCYNVKKRGVKYSKCTKKDCSYAHNKREYYICRFDNCKKFKYGTCGFRHPSESIKQWSLRTNNEIPDIPK